MKRKKYLKSVELQLNWYAKNKVEGYSTMNAMRFLDLLKLERQLKNGKNS